MVPSAAASTRQAFWVKYDNSGNVLWADGTQSGHVWLNNIATDTAGNLIVYGSFGSTNTVIGPHTLVRAPGTSIPFFLAKISPSGAVLWALCDGDVYSGPLSLSGTSALSLGGVTTDVAGNIYISGNFKVASMNLGGYSLPNTSATGLTYDVFVAKYAPDGTLLWASSYGGEGNDYGFDIAATHSGNVYVSGAFYSPLMTVGTSVIANAGGSATTGGKSAAFIARLSPAGVPLWAEAGVSPANKNSYAFGLTADEFDNVYMTGSYTDNSISFGTDTLIQTFPSAGSFGKYALFLVRYSPANIVNWSKTIGAPTPVLGWDVTLASCSQVWVVGSYLEDAHADSVIIPYVVGYEPHFIFGYDLSGGVAGFSGLASGGDDQSCIASDPVGNLFICSDYFTVPTYPTLAVGPDTLVPTFSTAEWFYVAKYENPVTPTDTFGATYDTTVCGFSSLLLQTVPGYDSYQWHDGSGFDTCRIDTTGTYFVIGRRCGDSIRIDTFHVAISAISDTVYNKFDTVVCSASGTVNLSASSGYTSYLWNTGDTVSAISVDSSGVFIAHAVSLCRLHIDTFNLSLHTAPVVSLGPDTIFCSGSTVVLSSSQPPGSAYIWSTGATTDTIHVASTGLYSLNVTNSDSCSASATVNITVPPKPVVQLGNDTAECSGNPVLLQSSVVYSSPSYLWSNFSTGPTLTASVSGTYWLQVTMDGCSGADTIHVAVVYDTFTIYNPDTAICKGNSVQVRTTGNPAVSYQWLPTAGIPFSTTLSPLIMPDTSAMYVLEGSFDGCPDKRDSFFIDVQPVPVVGLGGNRHVCEFDTLKVTPFVSPDWYGAYAYSWAPSAAIDFPEDKDVIVSVTDTTQLTLTVTTSAGCIGSDSAIIIVHPGNFGAIISDTGICPRDSVQLWASGGISYHWNPATDLSDADISSPWVRPVASRRYGLIVEDSYTCRDSLSVFISVLPGAVIHLTDSVIIAPGQAYQILPQTNCSQFLWTPAIGLNGRYIANPIATPEVSTKYKVLAVTEWGCKTEDAISIIVDATNSISLPNAFAPGNGALLRIITRGFVKLSYFRIYNRWGNLVFDANDIQDGWDGTYKGEPQAMDVFVYQLEAFMEDGRLVKKTGNITLLR